MNSLLSFAVFLTLLLFYLGLLFPLPLEHLFLLTLGLVPEGHFSWLALRVLRPHTTPTKSSLTSSLDWNLEILFLILAIFRLTPWTFKLRGNPFFWRNLWAIFGLPVVWVLWKFSFLSSTSSCRVVDSVPVLVLLVFCSKSVYFSGFVGTLCHLVLL